MRAFLLLFVTLLLAFTQTHQNPNIARVENGLAPPTLIEGEPTWSLEERMKHYQAPGLSIAVIKDFKVEWAKGYGVKDLQTGERVIAETLFQAGSISKPVAAMVALKKVQDGKLALDQDINGRLTSWKLPENELTATKKVTLANLLSHTAGLTVHGFPGYAVGEKLPTLPQVLDGAPPANTAPVRVNMAPGTKFRYSGGGTTIAQLAIMDLEKKPYPQIARETVLGPLKMNNSTYEQPLPDDWRKKAATGYRGNGKEVEGKIHIYPEMAAAGLWTTPTDLAKFAIEVQLSLAGKSNQVLSKEMVGKMVTPFIEDFIALGFFLEKHGNAMYFGHGGADEGFRAQLLVHKEKGYGAVVMVNSDNGAILGEVMRGIARIYEWEDFIPAPAKVAALEPTKLDRLAGRYQLDLDQVITVKRAGAGLSVDQTESSSYALLPVSDTAFIRKDRDTQYRFSLNDAGKAESISVKTGGMERTAGRIGDEVKTPLELLLAGDHAGAIAAYRKIKAESPQNPGVDEGRLNGIGYYYLREKKLPTAITLFQVNVELYPQSSNAYDSLAEAYMVNGQKELAIKNYKKSLELNPQNKSGAENLKKLEALP